MFTLIVSGQCGDPVIEVWEVGSSVWWWEFPGGAKDKVYITCPNHFNWLISITGQLSCLLYCNNLCVLYLCRKKMFKYCRPNLLFFCTVIMCRKKEFKYCRPNCCTGIFCMYYNVLCFRWMRLMWLAMMCGHRWWEQNLVKEKWELTVSVLHLVTKLLPTLPSILASTFCIGKGEDVSR